TIYFKDILDYTVPNKPYISKIYWIILYQIYHIFQRYTEYFFDTNKIFFEAYTTKRTLQVNFQKVFSYFLATIVNTFGKENTTKFKYKNTAPGEQKWGSAC
ncbi:MAG: hypothetical protein MJE68_16595, partial [Proteobacteria bacterium]|nr:hypothetical protein [Pseudomonadota bacterium]